MKILIAGATGMVGKALVNVLETNHTLFVLGRDKQKLNLYFQRHKVIDWDEFSTSKEFLNDIDVVINLCGENIGDKRWTKARKELILNSRVCTTNILAHACANSNNKNIRLLNASAIGVYGNSNDPDKIYDEHSTLPNPPQDFLSTVGTAWENALAPAEHANISVVKMRFGVVLSTHGGALAKMLPAFKFCLGGKIGSGKQAFSWISLDDLIRSIVWLIDHPTIKGAVNIVAPEVVTQKIFAKTLGKALHRPTFFSLPKWFIQLQFGQMGVELLLGGINVNSTMLENNGFHFLYPTVESALVAMLKSLTILRRG